MIGLIFSIVVAIFVLGAIIGLWWLWLGLFVIGGLLLLFGAVPQLMVLLGIGILACMAIGAIRESRRPKPNPADKISMETWRSVGYTGRH